MARAAGIDAAGCVMRAVVRKQGGRPTQPTTELGGIKPSSTRTHFLQLVSTSERPHSLPKQCLKLRTKCSNTEPIRGHLAASPTPPRHFVSFGLGCLQPTEFLFLFLFCAVLFRFPPFFPRIHITVPQDLFASPVDYSWSTSCLFSPQRQT